MSLRSLRREAGETQDQVARSIDVAPRSYVSWEAGDSKPSFDNTVSLLKHFTSVLGRPVHVTELVSDASPDPEEPDPAPVGKAAA